MIKSLTYWSDRLEKVSLAYVSADYFSYSFVAIYVLAVNFSYRFLVT